MLHAILLASLITLFAIVDASAQAAPANEEGFKGFIPGRTVSVFDGSGYQSTGRLLLATPETLTVAVNGSDVVFARKHVAAVFERRNSIQKGLILGLMSGPALGVAALASGSIEASDPYFATGVVLFSAIGAAVGTAIDAAIPEKRLLYVNPGNYERGDSIKNGIILGSVAGAAAGFTAGLFKDDCDHTPTVGPKYFVPLDCTADEKLAHGMKMAVLPGLAGAGLGALIDKMMVGQRLVYRAALSPSRLSLSARMSW